MTVGRSWLSPSQLYDVVLGCKIKRGGFKVGESRKFWFVVWFHCQSHHFMLGGMSHFSDFFDIILSTLEFEFPIQSDSAQFLFSRFTGKKLYYKPMVLDKVANNICSKAQVPTAKSKAVIKNRTRIPKHTLKVKTRLDDVLPSYSYTSSMKITLLGKVLIFPSKNDAVLVLNFSYTNIQGSSSWR